MYVDPLWERNLEEVRREGTTLKKQERHKADLYSLYDAEMLLISIHGKRLLPEEYKKLAEARDIVRDLSAAVRKRIR